MEILTVALRQNRTIMGKFMRKRNTFEVEDVVADKPLLPLLFAPNAELLDAQINYLIDAMEARRAQVYVTMPSGLCRQDYWLSDAKIADRGKLANWVETLFANEIKEEYAVGLPIVQRFEKKIYVSGAGIKKSYIDRLYSSFRKAGADLVAIEAESAAYVRAIARWESNYLLVDIDEDSTSVTAYCSKIGMYTATLPIGAAAIQADPVRMEELLIEIELAVATWNFPVEAPKQIFVTGEFGAEVIRLLRLKRENVYSIALPKAHMNEFNSDLLVLPIGTVYRNFYDGEKGTTDADTSHEFSSGGGRNRAGLSAYKEKMQQYFNIDRLRARFRRSR